MTTRKMEIQLPTGLEARPLAMLVQVASQFESKIYVESEDNKNNAKSIWDSAICQTVCGRWQSFG